MHTQQTTAQICAHLESNGVAEGLTTATKGQQAGIAALALLAGANCLPRTTIASIVDGCALTPAIAEAIIEFCRP